MTTIPAEAPPSANSPQLLARLLESVFRGLRSTRGLQEALGIESRTVQYYVRAGEWLGLLERADVLALSDLGVEYVLSRRDRPYLYARAVWSVPLVANLLRARPDVVPDLDAIAAALRIEHPDLAESTLRRRASAVRALVVPALGRRRPRPTEEHQLPLPLAVPTSPPLAPRIDAQAGRHGNPDVYRYLLAALLDHGELSLGHVRGLLDRAGLQDAPLGGYVDLAVQRGDAVRVDERLVITPSAVEARSLVASTASVIVSDPGFRRWVALSRQVALDDRPAEVARDRLDARYARWARRLFGRDVPSSELDRALEQVLLDRSLESFPARPLPSAVIEAVHEPFLDVWERPGLLVALPPSLEQLLGGLPAVNRLLERERHEPASGVPSVVGRPVASHGALVHPGEPLPRTVPDGRSLRVRAVMHAPFVCLLTAALLGTRRRPEEVAVQRRAGRWLLLRAGEPRGPLLDVLDAFARSRGWVVSRREQGAVDADTLLAVGEAIGLARRVGRHATLDEAFFGQLGTDPEELEVLAVLSPLADALDAWLEDAV